jgi:uncharacterized membrane protein YqjE
MSLLGAALSSSTRLPSLSQAASLASEALGHRMQLAGLELDEAGSHAQASLVLLAVSVLFGLLGGFAFTLTLAALVWDSPHRPWWLAGLCAAYLAISGIAAFVLARRFRTWRPFSETRAQLQQDQACLNQLIQTTLP